MKQSGYVVALSPSQFESTISTVFQEFADSVFWFAWCEEAIRLPGKMQDPSSVLDSRWNRVRIFTDVVELRRIRRHQEWTCLLLTEDQERIPSSIDWDRDVLLFPDVTEAYRVLVGDHLTIGWQTGQGLAITDAWGGVAYPKPLGYEGVDLGKGRTLVSRVRLYHDVAGRLRFVRYCRLEVVRRPDAQTLSGSFMEIKPYGLRAPES